MTLCRSSRWQRAKGGTHATLSRDLRDDGPGPCRVKRSGKDPAFIIEGACRTRRPYSHSVVAAGGDLF